MKHQPLSRRERRLCWGCDPQSSSHDRSRHVEPRDDVSDETPLFVPECAHGAHHDGSGQDANGPVESPPDGPNETGKEGERRGRKQEQRQVLEIVRPWRGPPLLGRLVANDIVPPRPPSAPQPIVCVSESRRLASSASASGASRQASSDRMIVAVAARMASASPSRLALEPLGEPACPELRTRPKATLTAVRWLE
jgi:hypothetical protein